MLADLPHDSARVDLLTGMQQGLLGRRQIAVPPAWPDTYARLSRAADADSRLQTLLLRFALLVNDPNAVRELRRQVANTALPAAVRREALEALMAKQVENLPALLLALLDGPTSQAEAEEIQRTALRGLADFDAGETPTVILRRYSAFSPLVRVDAIQTLTARPSWANQLLDAVETGAVPRQDLSAYAARQLSNLRDRKIEARVRALWGEVRVTPAEKVRRIHEFKRRLTPELLATADLAAGHRLYQDTCAKCHRLFGSGENVGPDITGAQRSNLDYLLENLIDPSASVSRDFQMQVVTTSSGRTLTGLLIGQADGTLQLRTLNETVTLPLDEVETREQSDLSMMPEGMLDNLTLLQVRDLIAYLQAPRPVD
jgi:putative heme-binding domain-containing protein